VLAFELVSEGGEERRGEEREERRGEQRGVNEVCDGCVGALEQGVREAV